MHIKKHMKITYQHLENLHHHYGVVLHGSVFLFSLFLGISIGILTLLFNVAKVKQQTQAMHSYENQIMNQLVKKIEAAPYKK